jgi:hypothetical protein
VLYSGAITQHTVERMDDAHRLADRRDRHGLHPLGGLKALAWGISYQGTPSSSADLRVLHWGSRVGGIEPFIKATADKLHNGPTSRSFRDAQTVLWVGLWIPNVLLLPEPVHHAADHWAAEKPGAMASAGISSPRPWLLIPFAIVFSRHSLPAAVTQPLASADQAFPTLFRNLVPLGLRGFTLPLSRRVIRPLLCAHIRCHYSHMICTKHWFGTLAKVAVTFGRIMTVVFMIGGVWIAPPTLNHPRICGGFFIHSGISGLHLARILARFFIFWLSGETGAGCRRSDRPGSQRTHLRTARLGI